MTTRKNLEALFAKFNAAEHFYLRSTDGHCSGTELCWMPAAQRWVWYDDDKGECGAAPVLTLILTSATICDSERGDLFTDLEVVSMELDNRAFVIVANELPDNYDLPDDAEVFEVDAHGLTTVDLAE
jgi:hypothetical protein